MWLVTGLYTGFLLSLFPARACVYYHVSALCFCLPLIAASARTVSKACLLPSLSPTPPLSPPRALARRRRAPAHRLPAQRVFQVRMRTKGTVHTKVYICDPFGARFVFCFFCFLGERARLYNFRCCARAIVSSRVAPKSSPQSKCTWWCLALRCCVLRLGIRTGGEQEPG